MEISGNFMYFQANRSGRRNSYVLHGIGVA